MNAKSERTRFSILLGVALSLFGGNARAQSYVFLANGTALEGKQTAEDPATAIATLQFSNGIEIEIPRLQVKSVLAKNEALDYYLDNSGKTADTVASHDSVYKYLTKSGFKELATAHLQRIVELEPSNRSAWRSLGYSETSAGWIPSEIYWKSKGMVRDGTRWRTPQDLAIAKLLEERKRSQSEIKRKIDATIRDLGGQGRRSEEANRFLTSLNDASALPILVEKMLDEKTDESTRLFLLDIILKLEARSLVRAVVKIYIYDESIQVRDRCLDYLIAHPSEEAVYQLRQYLVNKNPMSDRPDVINRAGEALSLLGDDRCVPDLIAALVTKHESMVGPDTKYNVGFSNNGLTNFSQGGQRKVEQQSRNSSVLGALSSITGADFAYDRQAWLDWYANSKANTNLPLRRDP